MTQRSATFRNGRIFDGSTLHDGLAIRFNDGKLAEWGPDGQISVKGDEVDLAGDIISPGYVDLQVNGGDGIMFNDDPSPQTLGRIAAAHRRLGVTALLPTLITDTPETTRAAIAAAIDAIRAKAPGIAGLHLEGPHLSIARKGAHDPALIRPMQQDDLEALLAAAEELPVLKVTVAPESVSEEQVERLSRAGILVSLGHTDADFDTCRRYFAAGARCVTPLVQRDEPAWQSRAGIGRRGACDRNGVVGADRGQRARAPGLHANGLGRKDRAGPDFPGQRRHGRRGNR